MATYIAIPFIKLALLCEFSILDPILLPQVSVADFSGYLSRLSTPRELMIMMTEMFARIEAKPNDQLKAEDMEFAVSKALEQAV